MKRAVIVGALVTIPLVAIGVYAFVEYWPSEPPPLLAAPHEPRLPDLTMPALVEFNSGVDESGKQSVFFTATIANVGEGPFIVHAARGDERGGWRVSQRFLETDGSTSERVTPGTMVFGGHGHNHWHVRLGATYQLRTPAGKLLRQYEKVGYCFFDQVPLEPRLPDAPKAPVYPSSTCSGESRLELDMGLSPGWNDPYQWTLPDQRLDITGLPDGEYRLWAKADPGNWFRESDETNNVSWADIRLTTSASPPRVDVLRQEPAPTEP